MHDSNALRVHVVSYVYIPGVYTMHIGKGYSCTTRA